MARSDVQEVFAWVGLSGEEIDDALVFLHDAHEKYGGPRPKSHPRPHRQHDRHSVLPGDVPQVRLQHVPVHHRVADGEGLLASHLKPRLSVLAYLQSFTFVNRDGPLSSDTAAAASRPSRWCASAR